MSYLNVFRRKRAGGRKEDVFLDRVIDVLLRPGHGESSNEDRVDTLCTIVFDLLVEVEALRASHLSMQAARDDYARAYRDLAMLSRSTYSGPHQIVERFYPRTTARLRSWREELFMQRAGASEGDVAAYRDEVRRVSLVERTVFFREAKVEDLYGTFESLGAERLSSTPDGSAWRFETPDGASVHLNVIENFDQGSVDRMLLHLVDQRTLVALGHCPKIALEVSRQPEAEEVAQRFLRDLIDVHPAVVQETYA